MGQWSPNEHFLVAHLGIAMAWGIAATWGGSSVLIVGAGVCCWGKGELATLFWSQTSFQMLTLSLAKECSVWVGHWVYLPVVEGWIFHFEVWLFDIRPQQTVM